MVSAKRTIQNRLFISPIQLSIYLFYLSIVQNRSSFTTLTASITHFTDKFISCFRIRFICLEKSNNHSTSHNHFHMKQLQIQTDCSYCNCHIPICILYSKLQFFLFRACIIIIHVCLSHCLYFLCIYFHFFVVYLMRFHFDFQFNFLNADSLVRVPQHPNRL